MQKREARYANTTWGVFAFLWAATVLVDRAKRHDLDFANLCVVVPAIVLTVRPQSLAWFVTLAVAQVYWWFATLSTQIIWNVSGTLHCTLLLALASLVVARRSLCVSRAELSATLVQPIRALLVLGMGFAGFAKLNHDFLEPELSCGAVYYLWMTESPLLSWLPTGPSAQTGAVGFGVASECAGPLLLLFRRTRPVGLLLLLGLWLGLALSPRSHYFDFAGLFLAMSLFFIPPAAIHGAVVRLRWWARRAVSRLHLSSRRAAVPHGLRLFWITTLTVVVLGSSFGFERTVLMECYRYIILLLWLALSGTIAFSWYCFAGRPRAALTRRAALVWLGPLVFALNELSAYVGFPHRPTMTMAANLVLTPVDSNHLLVDPVPTVSWSRKVTIVRSSNRALKPGRSMPWLRFVDLLARHPNATAHVRVDDGPVQALSAGRDESLQRGSWLSRLLRLRDYASFPGARQACSKSPPGFTARQWRNEAQKRLRRLNAEE